MYTSIFKKAAPSRKFFAFMFSVVASFAVSSALNCMDLNEESHLVQSGHIIVPISDESERKITKVSFDPELLVLIGFNQKLLIPIDFNQESSVSTNSDRGLLAFLDFNQELLVSINPKQTREKAEKLTYCLYLLLDPDYYDGIKEKAKAWGVPSSINIDNFEEFKGYLVKIAQEIAEQNLLGRYIIIYSKRAEDLTQVVQKYQEKEKSLTQAVQEYQKNQKNLTQIVQKYQKKEEILIQVVQEYQKKEKEFEKIITDTDKDNLIKELNETIDIKNEKIIRLQYDKQFWWYFFPSVVVSVGVIAGLVGYYAGGGGS